MCFVAGTMLLGYQVAAWLIASLYRTVEVALRTLQGLINISTTALLFITHQGLMHQRCRSHHPIDIPHPRHNDTPPHKNILHLSSFHRQCDNYLLIHHHSDTHHRYNNPRKKGSSQRSRSPVIISPTPPPSSLSDYPPVNRNPSPHSDSSYPWQPSAAPSARNYPSVTQKRFP